jgi:serine protease AprX
MKPLRYSLYSLLLAGLASAQPGTKGPEFANLPANGNVQVLVQFQGSANGSLLSAIAGKGANQTKSYKHVNAAVFTVPAGKVDAIAALPGVKYISTDRPVQAHLDITVPTVNANLAHQYGWTGQGIGVAVIDSGVSPHPDLRSFPYGSRIVYNQSFVANDPTTADAYGHGTHVAGIVGGNGASSFGSRVNMGGIAPGVNIINLRALDANGQLGHRRHR